MDLFKTNSSSNRKACFCFVKGRNNMKKAFIITVTFLSIAVFVLTAMLISSNNALTSANMSLENLYQRSFYELVNNVNNVIVHNYPIYKYLAQHIP